MSNTAKAGSPLFPEDELKEGVSLSELAGASVRAGLVPSACGREEAWLDEFLARHRHPGNELIVLTSDARTCSLMVQPTTDGEMFLVIKDISALSAQAAIACESAQRRVDFAETAADWMWEIDEKTKFTVLTQPGVSDILVADLLGQKFLELPFLAMAEAERRQIAEKLAERQAFRDLRLQYTQDEQSWALSLSGKPFFSENGEYRGHRGTFRDVTRDVRAQRELMEAKDHAEVGSRSKSEFLAHMSHELRSPLNAILGFSEIMSMGLYGKIEQPKYLEYVDTTHESGAHLLSIINDILDISRIESGKVELNEQDVDLEGLFESCLNLIGGRASEAGHTVQGQLMPEMPQLWADERLTKQILINLLGNAVKFTPYGGRITLGVEVTARACVRFWVSDNGPGMSQEDQARALIPFDRGSAMTKSETQGAGLGLPLCKMLAELRGGQLTLENNAAGGLTVSVEYPIERTIETKVSAHA
ncbi:MAG: PAS domain-containing sensor histidine kinase [Alphaproteobacteria bacterium]|nr:PAS domain-containing sensor histidine kinase [Alphaproteobacteria bacterium]